MHDFVMFGRFCDDIDINAARILNREATLNEVGFGIVELVEKNR